MSKIIINVVDDDIDLQQALACINQVVSAGKIDVNDEGLKHYRWVTYFGNGLQVFTHIRENKKTVHSFTVIK